MIDTIKNRDLFYFKRGLLSNENKYDISSLCSFNYLFHNITIKLSSNSNQIIKLFDSLGARKVDTNDFEIQINVFDLDHLDIDQEYFESEPSSNCVIEGCDDFKSIIQRDFVLSQKSQKFNAFLFASNSDAFFNLLRFILPRRFLATDSLLLHSSSLVSSKNKKSVLFLGHSGAGKSTTALNGVESSDNFFTLGDDMNVVSRTEGEWTLRSAALGGISFYPWGVEKYPISAVYWLKQSNRNRVVPLSASTAFLKLIASAPNLFFDKYQNILPSEQTLFHQASSFVSDVPFFELELTNDDVFLENILL